MNVSSNICLTVSDVTRTGGIERMCCLLANALSEKGYKVMVVSQNAYYWKRRMFHLDGGIKVRSMKRTALEWAICHFLPSLRYDSRKYRTLLRLHHTQLVIDVDTELSLMTAEAVKSSGTRTISWEHFCYRRFSSRDISRRILDCIRDNVDRLVVLTRSDRSSFVEEAGLPAGKVCQIYNPSPIEKCAFIEHRTHKVLAMGRVCHEKGFDILLEAWSKIEATGNGWELEIVGEGPLKGELMAQASSLNLKRVSFSPFTDKPEEKYRSASIYALSSRHEGFPLVLLEAANMSLPIVAFDCPNGPREIVQDNVNGILVKPEDADLLAESLLRLMDDEALRDRLGRNALASVSKFRKETVIREWTTLIDSLISEK